MEPSSGFSARLVKRLEHYSNRKWYLPLIGVLAFLDLFVIVIPSEGVLVSTVLLRPRQWMLASSIMTLGSALGAVALTFLIRMFGQPFLQGFMQEALGSKDWQNTSQFIDQHGAIALSLLSLSPLPQQPAVAICALSHMPATWIFIAVLVGRAPKYFGFGYAATHAPHLLGYLTRRKSEAKDL